jgi:hypothetical protein
MAGQPAARDRVIVHRNSIYLAIFLVDFSRYFSLFDMKTR